MRRKDPPRDLSARSCHATVRPISERLVPFLYELRKWKLKAGIQEVVGLAKAVSLGLHGSLDGFYYVARSLMVHRESDLDRFDEAFLARSRACVIESRMVERYMSVRGGCCRDPHGSARGNVADRCGTIGRTLGSDPLRGTRTPSSQEREACKHRQRTMTGVTGVERDFGRDGTWGAASVSAVLDCLHPEGGRSVESRRCERSETSLRGASSDGAAMKCG